MNTTISTPWPDVEIRDIASIGTGSKDTQDRAKNGKYPFFVRSQNIERIDSWSFDGEAVLTAGDGVGTGKVFHYINGKFDYHQRVYRISNFHSDVSGRYFFYQFSRNFLARIESLTAKSSVDSVRMEAIAGMSIPLPSRGEQDRIVSAIDDAADLVAGLERMIAKKEAIKQGVMQQIFSGRTRLPGYSGPWRTVALGDIATISDGTHQTPTYVSAGVPFYSVENITADNFADTKFISEKEYQSFPTSGRIEQGDILMTRIGSIGDCRLVDWDTRAGYYVSLALIKVRDNVSAPFVAQYSHSNGFKVEVESHSLVSAIPKKINLGPISEIKLSLPPSLEEQQKIATILADMDLEIATLRKQLSKTVAIAQGMTQELLSGRSRLPISEDAS